MELCVGSYYFGYIVGVLTAIAVWLSGRWLGVIR